MTAERRPAPGQGAQVERFKRAAGDFLLARSTADRERAWTEFRGARDAITWEDCP